MRGKGERRGAQVGRERWRGKARTQGGGVLVFASPIICGGLELASLRPQIPPCPVSFLPID